MTLILTWIESLHQTRRGTAGLHEQVEFIVQAGAVGGARAGRIGAGEQA
jgi:hypothetical protein